MKSESDGSRAASSASGSKASLPRKEIASFGVIPFRTVPSSAKQPSGKLEFLMIQHNGGHWSFPKGRPEPTDTSAMDSALREFSEETGLPRSSARILSLGPYRQSYTYERPHAMVDKSVTYYVGEVPFASAVKVQASEIKNHAWLVPQMVMKQCTHREDRQMFEKVAEAIQQSLSSAEAAPATSTSSNASASSGARPIASVTTRSHNAS